jgi:hypothetical protein
VSYAFAVWYSDVLTEPQEALTFYHQLGWDWGVIRPPTGNIPACDKAVGQYWYPQKVSQ